MVEARDFMFLGGEDYDIVSNLSAVRIVEEIMVGCLVLGRVMELFFNWYKEIRVKLRF